MIERNEWLAARKKMIGASDVAAILGENPFRTNIDVWMDKTGRGQFDFDNDHLKFGRDVEGAIAGLYETRLQRPVKDLGATVVQIHPDIPWLGATLDRLTTVQVETGGSIEIPLELKHVGGIGVNKADWEDDPPAMYQIQVQIQCECYRDEKNNKPFCGSLAGMFPGYQLAWGELERSIEFFETIFPVLDEFWNYNVAKDIAPKLLEHDRNLDTMRRLYPNENGKTMLLDSTVLHLVNERDALSTQIGEYTKEKKQIEAELRSILCDYSFGALPDGTFLTLKEQHRKEYVCKASSFRVLRRTKRLK